MFKEIPFNMSIMINIVIITIPLHPCIEVEKKNFIKL